MRRHQSPIAALFAAFCGSAAGIGIVRARLARLNGANKAEALACHGADQLLILAAVANGLARRVDAAGECRIRHHASSPDRGEQIVFADDVVPVSEQINQEVEHLRLDRNKLTAPTQFSSISVKHMIFKDKLQ